MNADEAGREYPSYDVTIRRAADGVERVVHHATAWGDGSWFWWAEGNACCDCNRFIDFERAVGEQPDFNDERCQCGDGKYLVTRFTFPDGTTMTGPDGD